MTSSINLTKPTLINFYLIKINVYEYIIYINTHKDNQKVLNTESIKYKSYFNICKLFKIRIKILVLYLSFFFYILTD
jgi:hypothetical protein